jgi:hypothetical protein
MAMGYKLDAVDRKVDRIISDVAKHMEGEHAVTNERVSRIERRIERLEVSSKKV